MLKMSRAAALPLPLGFAIHAHAGPVFCTGLSGMNCDSGAPQGSTVPGGIRCRSDRGFAGIPRCSWPTGRTNW